MKKLVSLFAIAAVSAPAMLAVDPSAVTIDKVHGLGWPGGAEVDLNNDGYLDLVIGGKALDDGNGRVVEDVDGNPVTTDYQAWQKIWNPATKSYDVSEFPILLGERVYTAFADFNNDGILDLFATSSANQLNIPFNIGLYVGKSDGTFAYQPMTIKDADGNDFPFRPTAVDVADFNNDGLMDIVGIGWWADPNGKNTDKDSGEKYSVANAVLLNKGNFTFDATNTDVISYIYALDNVRVGDFNNDGYADFVTAGNADKGSGPTKNGKYLGRALEVYLNLGQEAINEGDFAFYATAVADVAEVGHMGNANLAVADFDNDGYSDIAATGESESDLLPANNWGFVSQLLVNKKGEGFSRLKQQVDFDIRPLNSSSTGIRAIDYNGDGNYDFAITGWNEGMLDGSANTQSGWIFSNPGNGVFNNFERVPGGSEAAIFFTEDGVRGARNYFFAGQSWDKHFGFKDEDGVSGRTSAFFTNPNKKAARPDAPTAKSAEVNDATVVLSWTPAASSKKNVTYEVYIKNKATGAIYKPCTSFIGGDLDGVRKLMAAGNAFQNTSITINNMHNGTYEWGVQTINASYEGSTFATGEFKVVNGGVAEFKADNVKVYTVAGGVEVSCEGDASVEIYTVSGMLVDNAKFTGNYNVKLAGGCYLVKVTTATGSNVKKVVL